MKNGINYATWATWEYFTSTFEKLKSDAIKASAKWLAPNSPERKLAEEGIGYLTGAITDESFKSTNGYVIFPTPYHEWVRTKRLLRMNETKYIGVVTDPSLIEALSNYGYFNQDTYDVDVRKNMDFFHKITNYRTILNKNDASVINERKEIRNTLNKEDSINPVFDEGISQWLDQVDGKTVDFTYSFKVAMFKMIPKAVMGIHKLPEGKQLDDLIRVVDELDKKVTLEGESYECLQIAKKMQDFSKWILTNNKETILKGKNIVTDIIKKEDVEKINIGLIFAAASNITRLMVTTLTFLAYHPIWQQTVREAILKKDRKFLKGFYQECCRLFISTAFTGKYISKNFETTSQNGNKVMFPAGTTVFIPHRRLDFHHYENPTTFNPYRSEFFPTEKDVKPIKINTVKLSPFGLGLRSCPASTAFTEPAFYYIIELMMKHCILLKPQDSQVKFEIPSERSPYAKLTDDYFVTIKKTSAFKALTVDQNIETFDMQNIQRLEDQLVIKQSSNDILNSQEIITNMYNLRIDNGNFYSSPSLIETSERKDKSPLRKIK